MLPTNRKSCGQTESPADKPKVLRTFQPVLDDDVARKDHHVQVVIADKA
jgi:hypothetical protein